MPLKKVVLKPGVNRENTRYTTEGGWFDADKVRFRQGFPEKIGGWQRISDNTFLGVAKSLWGWATLAGSKLVGVGTHLKFYIERGGAYYDITPLRETQALTDPFTTTSGSSTVSVTDVAHGGFTGDYVIFSGATAVGGLTIDGEYTITVLDADTYTIVADAAASGSATGGGSVTAAYQLNIGGDTQASAPGYGSGTYGTGPYGIGGSSIFALRLYSQSNFGEDLVFSYRGGSIYYWDASAGVTTRGGLLSSLAGASDVPEVVLHTKVSDINRFVLAFGCNALGSSVLDPMLIRWSAQEDAADWTPAATNQAGSLRLSRGSEIVTAIQSRQEIIVWTDQALYGLQYLGAPDAWGAQLLGDNISILSPNSAIYVSGVAYWMGTDKFYRYDGNVLPLRCDLRRYIFDNINLNQKDQIFVGLNERFNEIWWFYPSAGSTTTDRYVVYNHVEGVWTYGNMSRSAWIESKIRANPIAATFNNKLVYHELGYDDEETSTPAAIEASITSSEFDLEDGDRFMFIKRILPDMTFRGSTVDGPSATMSILNMRDSGSGYTSPPSQGGTNETPIMRTETVPIEEFTGEAYVRVRGRQIAIKIESTGLGVSWQLGSPRLDMRPDGRAG